MENLIQNSGLKLLSFDSLSHEANLTIASYQSYQAAVERNDWHTHFILEAYLASTRSLDSQTRCGCVIVRDKTVISTGYNSFVRNIKDDVLPNVRPAKYPFMIHSEHNAILTCAKNGISTDGTSAYVTGPPCCNCLQYLYQAGIKEIYFPNNNKAEMTKNSDYDTQFEILAHLMPSLLTKKLRKKSKKSKAFSSRKCIIE